MKSFIKTASVFLLFVFSIVSYSCMAFVPIPTTNETFSYKQTNDSHVLSGVGDEYFYDGAKTSEFYMNNDPCTIYDPYSDSTFVAMHGPDYDPYVIFYNHTTDEWSSVYQAGTNPLPNDDAHGAPVLWVNTTGYVHILFGAHGGFGNNRFEHRVTENAYDISSWTDMMDAAIDEKPTYPQAYYDDINNVVHLVFRSRNVDDNDYRYQNSTDNGNSWSTSQLLVDVDETPAEEHVYPSYGGIDPYDTEIIHIPFRIYNESTGDSERIFYSYMNVTTGVLYNATGDSMGTTITQDELSYVTAYGQTGNGLFWTLFFVHPDSSGNIFVTAGNFSYATTNVTVCFLYWNVSTTSWSSPSQIYATPAYSQRAQFDFFLHDSDNITLFMPVGKNMTRFIWDGSTWTLAEWIRNSTTRQLAAGMTTQSWNGSYNPEMMMVYSEWLQDVTDAKAYAWGIDEIEIWQTVDFAEFVFPVNWGPDVQFGYDAFFIFLGLIMIPVSTMYLVRGGRKEMNTDKLFLGLIIFAVGLGFLIGGILP